jgi:hypothetical protein
MSFGAQRLPFVIHACHHQSMRRDCFHLLLACIATAACGSSTEPTSQVDHLELRLDPARPAYPVGDFTVLHVAVFDKNGAPLPSAGVTLRSLSPAVAAVSAGSFSIAAVGNGTAVIEASLEGKTAQITVNVRGTLHQNSQMLQSETWRVADTPHVVTTWINVGKLTLNSPDTVVLTIEPGSTVRFRTGAGLYFGDIAPAALRIADGAPVVMEADTIPAHAGSWIGLLFKRAGHSALHHLTLRHCGHDIPFDNTAACLIAAGSDPGTDLHLLLDDVTIADAHNGVDLGGWFTITPGSKNLSITNTEGFMAHVSAQVFGGFPTGGTFTGNASNEILITLGALRHSAVWREIGPPLRLSGGVIVPMDANAILTLVPGFHLRADAGAGFTFLAGGIVAGDTAGQPVVLESTGQGWGGISTEHAGLSTLNNVVLRDCGVSRSGCLVLEGLCASDSGLVANDLTIQGSKSTGVWMGICGKIHAASRNLTVTGSASVPFDLTSVSLPALPAGNYVGNGWDVARVRFGVAQRMRWHNIGIPYALMGGYSADSTLTLGPGITIQVDTGKAFVIGWGLISEGTAAEPITFTSITPGVPGSWMGIIIGNPPEGAQFDHVIIADAGGGPTGYSGAIRFDVDPGGVLTNSTIVRSSSCALILFNGNSWTDDYTDPLFGNTFMSVAGPLRCQV